MKHKLTLQDIDIEGKRVLMRVDFNVPLDERGNIRDDSRIRLSLPSIRYTLSQGGRLVLMSHLGRPKGVKESALSLSVCAKRLSDILDMPVEIAPDCVGGEVENRVNRLKSGEALLLENLRFYHAESDPESDPNFAKQLGKLGDVYVNDAFGTAHRKHSSTYFVCDSIPGAHVAGFLMERELEYLSGALENPKRPFYAIIGGAKVSSKIGVLQSLSKQVDCLYIGGAMAYTFLKVQGHPVGNSYVDEEHIEIAEKLLECCETANVCVHLPIDHVVAKGIDDISGAHITGEIPDGMMGLDIGRETLRLWEEQFHDAGTIFWNGPVGVFEKNPFKVGTCELATYLSESRATTIVGGGDSVAAINAMGLSGQFSHISTGGGAALELIEKGSLPAIEKLDDKK